MNLQFYRIRETDTNRLDALCELMGPYIAEICAHQSADFPGDAGVRKIAESTIARQSYAERFFELAVLNDQVLGFYHAKIDRAEDMGYVKPGYGTIMEFYVKPEYRRKGVGTQMYQRICADFNAFGVEKMYLTTDPVTGKPFWERLGFRFLGEVSPENTLEILEIAIKKP